MKPETRDTTLTGLTVGQGASGTSRRIRGRAIRYNSVSGDLGGFIETFARGSVKLAEDVPVLFGHDSTRVLGRVSSGTARVYDDGLGVVFEVDVPDTSWARDLVTSMERGDISQCSFAFLVGDDTFHYSEAHDAVLRTVRRAVVTELSIVSMPAYEETSATVMT